MSETELNVQKRDSLASPLTSTRKVLEGRKKLKEFYRLQAQTKENETDSPITVENALSLLDDEEKMKKYLQNTPIDEILKLRNTIAYRLNSHDSEKKSIIYDNYYELIKLRETLNILCNSDNNKDQATSILASAPKQIIDSNYLDSVLSDLNEFVDNKVFSFHNSFEQIIENVQSVQVNSKTNSFENIDKEQLDNELDILLLKSKTLTSKQNSQLIVQLQEMTTSINNINPLLVNQINQLIISHQHHDS